MKATAYKDVTLQQLRSFCATARQGSLSAAAEALDLALPTVWKQVHALEQAFGSKLIETHRRGCRLTEAGDILRRLVESSLANLDHEELRTRFAEEMGQTNIQIAIVGQLSLLIEDLPPCLGTFMPSWPRACFSLCQAHSDEVAAAVDSGEANLGFTTYADNRDHYPHLTFDPWYELEVILVTPHDHPLSRRRRVRPEDLKPYPLVNMPTVIHDPQIHGTLVKLGLYQTGPRRVEARYNVIVRSCVERGLGIALVTGVWPRETSPRLHERGMYPYLGPVSVYLVRRSGAQSHAAVDAFAEEVRRRLAPRRKTSEVRGATNKLGERGALAPCWSPETGG